MVTKQMNVVTRSKDTPIMRTVVSVLHYQFYAVEGENHAMYDHHVKVYFIRISLVLCLLLYH